MPKRPKESVYYPAVQKFLNRLGYVCQSIGRNRKPIPFITKGIGQIIVDALASFGENHPYLKLLFEAFSDGDISLSKIRGELAHGGVTLLHKKHERLVRKHVHEIERISLGGFTPLQSSKLDAAAASLRATPMQVALAWLLQRSPNMLLIPGIKAPSYRGDSGRSG